MRVIETCHECGVELDSSAQSCPACGTRSLSSAAASHTLSKTVRGVLRDEQILTSLRNRYPSGSVVGNGREFEVKGYNDELGGINYTATCHFRWAGDSSKTTITVDIALRTTGFFWLFVAMGLFGYGVGALLPIAFYYWGQNRVNANIVRVLDEIAEEMGYVTTQPSLAPTEPAEGTRVCPHCAEIIKAAAIKCRYCGSELQPADADAS